MNDQLERLAAVIRRASGIRLAADRYPALAAAAVRAAPTLRLDALLAAVEDTPGRGDLLGRLVDEVTVNETFFFRHPAELLALDWRALLEVARASGSPRIRVWVAGCSSGEEAYTLAILASEAFAPLPAPVSILATDISTTALAAAERAAYRARSVRGITPALRERYFTVDRDYLVVAGQLRSIVRFKHHNLVHAAGPGTAATFDLVTCRNTLIYFDPPTVDNVIGSLQRSVSRGGTLILGAADRISASPPAAGAIPALAPGRPRSTPDASPKHKRMPAPQQPKAGPSDPGVATVEAGLVAAVAAADAGDLDTAVELAGAVLASEPLNAQAHFIRGLALLSNGDPRAAAESLRRALYVRPDFALAAFNLGRALELTGDRAAASNSYTRALRNCDGPRAEVATDDEISPGDLAAACRLRIRALANPTVPQTGRAGPAR